MHVSSLPVGDLAKLGWTILARLNIHFILH